VRTQPMRSGICPECQFRKIIVRLNYDRGIPENGHFIAIREHEPCGKGLAPLDVQEIPVLPVSKIK
jgi:hypothetical protein